MNKWLYLCVAAFLAMGTYTFADEIVEECAEGEVMNEELGICVPAPTTDVEVEETTN